MLTQKKLKKLSYENWIFLKNKVNQKLGPTAQILLYEHILKCNGM